MRSRHSQFYFIFVFFAFRGDHALFRTQARHGKKKRLEETLNTGFDINAEDALGNTLLLVAVQQLQVGYRTSTF